MVAFAHWQAGYGAATALTGIVFVLATFACVVLHEFGHALIAKRFVIKTRDITLLPIGGARLERMPTDPRQELWVALAGPAVNVVIAIVLFLVLVLIGTLTSVESLTLTSGSFAKRLMIVTVLLVIFNIIPAFPMDGGRVLRALLAMRMDYTRATRRWPGTGHRPFVWTSGSVRQPFLIFIALFVWIGAAQESAMTQMNSVLGGIPVEAAMIYRLSHPSRTGFARRVVELLLSGSQQDFPVMENDTVVGILTRADLLAALARRAGSKQ